MSVPDCRSDSRMRAASYRHGLVVACVLATGLVAATIQPRVRDVALPSLAPLVAHAGWRIVHSYDRGGGNHFAFRQWTVRNQRGIQATVYLGATGDLKQ